MRCDNADVKLYFLNEAKNVEITTGCKGLYYYFYCVQIVINARIFSKANRYIQRFQSKHSYS
jgi:hypothetical protein